MTLKASVTSVTIPTTVRAKRLITVAGGVTCICGIVPEPRPVGNLGTMFSLLFGPPLLLGHALFTARKLCAAMSNAALLFGPSFTGTSWLRRLLTDAVAAGYCAAGR